VLAARELHRATELRRRVLFDPVDLKAHAGLDHFERERVLRDHAFGRLKREGLVEPADLVLVQDFDEFLDPRAAPALRRWFWWPWRSYVFPTYACSYYFLDYQIVHPRDHLRQRRQVAFRAGYGWDEGFSVHRLRNSRPKPFTRRLMGWHHSYLGGFDFIAEKVKAFAHADDWFLKGVPTAELQERILRGEDLFGRDFRFRVIDDYAVRGIPDLVERTDLRLAAGRPGGAPGVATSTASADRRDQG